jgi:hypothetical protein
MLKGFQERCMIARGYYKVSRDASQQRQPAVANVVPTQAAPVAPAASASGPVAATQAAPAPAAPTPATAAAAPRYYAQLYLVKGRIVSNPPQEFSAEFFNDTRKASVILMGRRLLQGDFELFPISASIQAKYTAALIKPDSVKTVPGADLKGFARFTDIDLELECAYTLVSSTGRGAGLCNDNQGNGYRIVF